MGLPMGTPSAFQNEPPVFNLHPMALGKEGLEKPLEARVWEGDQEWKPPATREIGYTGLVLPQNKDEGLSRGGWVQLGLCGYKVWDLGGDGRLHWIWGRIGENRIWDALFWHFTMSGVQGYIRRPSTLAGQLTKSTPSLATSSFSSSSSLRLAQDERSRTMTWRQHWCQQSSAPMGAPDTARVGVRRGWFWV